jgi:hypothetical protein
MTKLVAGRAGIGHQGKVISGQMPILEDCAIFAPKFLGLEAHIDASFGIMTRLLSLPSGSHPGQCGAPGDACIENSPP